MNHYLNLYKSYATKNFFYPENLKLFLWRLLLEQNLEIIKNLLAYDGI
jgi:hypothetical protein